MPKIVCEGEVEWLNIFHDFLYFKYSSDNQKRD